MGVAVIFIIIVAAVLVSVFKAKNINENRKEEKRREEEKLKPRPAAQPQPIQNRKPDGKVKKADPFPSYRVDPFAEIEKYAGSLSPAQLNEWLLDFAAAEKAGARRPEKGQYDPVFKRYLLESGFSYRLTRKLRGYAPQNRLVYTAAEIKKRPAIGECRVMNGSVNLPEQEPKTAPVNIIVRQRAITAPLEKKDVRPFRALYESFYKGKD